MIVQRRTFARDVGLLARTFHECGLVHKDFYLGHIFVVPEADSGVCS